MIGHERLGQKLRTRRDLLAAVHALIDRGAEINLAAVADEARFSRATAYRYFSDPAAPALEAILDGAGAVPENVIPKGASARERVHAVRRYWLSFYRASENRVRVLAARAMVPGPDGAPRFRRMARRLPMFVEALPLAAASGFESYVAVKYVLRIDEELIEKLSKTILNGILEKYGTA
ncbi:TetR/AcrR family transcriptional regulator [Rhizobium sp. BR 315]|uniref:TetR/AcrR family transcriptional regulator n=1 Tax=Rhizobium sp. BR 315 TaxID=3040014 RepID=UPI003D345DE7